MKKLLFLALLASCQADPVSVSSTNNADVPVALLFESGGCKVYRFYDGGRHHYFAKCARADVSVTEQHRESCGKNCTTVRSEEVPTVNE